MTSTTAKQDEIFMALALRLARRGLGSVMPNPAVGAVIVDASGKEVIARGWTQPGGRPHAEKEALRRAGERARGATMYVTLEPCAHTGRLPTCADTIIDAQLARVVCAIGDPDPRISGRGLADIAEAGIEVTTGVLAEQAWWTTAGHIFRNTRQRPFVQLKMATSATGAVPRGTDGKPTWVTGEAARAYAHLLRAEVDAILVGMGTVRDDDPSLTCRLPGLASRSPIRVVLDATLEIARSAQLVATAREVPTWVLADERVPAGRSAALRATGVEVIGAGSARDRRLDPIVVLRSLAMRGVTRLLVEGGPAIWKAFMASGVVDEVIWFRQGRCSDDVPMSAPVGLEGFRLIESAVVGEDRVMTFRRPTGDAIR